MNNKSLNGMTVIETLLALIMLSLLMGVLFYIFSVSASSWIKSRNSLEIRESAQVTITRIEKMLRGSDYDTVLIQTSPGNPDPNNAISFLSGYDQTTGITSYDTTTGKILWKKFVIFYLKKDTHVTANGYYQLLSKEIDLGDYKDVLPPGKILEQLPYPPLSATDPNSTNSMSFYITTTGSYVSASNPGNYISAARTVSRNITKLLFDSSVTNSIDITINTGKPVNPNDPNSLPSPEKMKLKSYIAL